MIEIPARGSDRRRDRRARGVLQLRHQRPHPDDVRLLARRRRGQVPHAVMSSARSCPRTPSRSSTRPASASSCGWGSRGACDAAGPQGRASAVSTAAIRRASRSATSVGLELRVVLTVPGAGGAPCRRPGGDRLVRGAGPLGRRSRRLVRAEGDEAARIRQRSRLRTCRSGCRRRCPCHPHSRSVVARGLVTACLSGWAWGPGSGSALPWALA